MKTTSAIKRLTGPEAIVIGSGPAGTACALRLAEAGRQVRILEAGRAITDPPGSHLRNQPRFDRDPDAFFGAVASHLTPVANAGADDPLHGAAESTLLGGQGILWTNNCPRAATQERWDAMSPALWEQRYSVAERLLLVDPDVTRGSRTADAIGIRLRDRLAAHGRQIRPLPFSGTAAPEQAVHFNGPRDILDAAAASVRDRIRA